MEANSDKYRVRLGFKKDFLSADNAFVKALVNISFNLKLKFNIKYMLVGYKNIFCEMVNFTSMKNRKYYY